MRPSPVKVASQFLYRKAMDDVDDLTGLLALFHAIYWLHWTTHWQTNGDSFYGDHTLFERLYLAMPSDIDTLAEKMVQLYGREAVSVHPHLRVVGGWLNKWAPEEGGDPNLVGRLLAAERDLQQMVKQTYDGLKSRGSLSLGLDDFLMNVANSHETALYLLQQRMGGIMTLGGKAASGAPSEEGRFFDSPRQREPREFAQSGALTNVADVSSQARYDNGPVKAEHHRLQMSPMTPMEVVRDTPGSGEFSTLSRYVVQTKHPTDRGVPDSHDEIPKHPNIV